MSKVLKEISQAKVRRGNGRAKTAAGYIRGIQDALATGADLEARRLADEGHRVFPDNEKLRRWAILMAPPKVLDAHLPAHPTIEEDYKWLKANAAKYHGQWVALKDGELYGVAATVRELRQNHDLPKGVLLTQVY